MSIILLLIPVSLAIAAAFVGAFIWAVRSGQYEDTCTPSLRVLNDDGTLDPAASRGEGQAGGGIVHPSLGANSISAAAPPENQ